MFTMPQYHCGQREKEMTYVDNINKLTNQYNDAIRALEDSYDMESTQSHAWNLTSSHLKKQYSKKYEALAREYRQKRKSIIEAHKLSDPQWVKERKLWGWMFVAAVVLTMMCCVGALPEEETAPVSAFAEMAEARTWNADNIPIPYLQDSTQYVSNPDSVLTQPAVNRMNVTLQRLNLDLGVQSVVIVVNHIENDDPFRFAQDVGNKYGVGYNDRGLVIVVGYLDHSINMSPGRGLEADLTDAECHRLEQEYVVPAMRAEKPDSGMVYLVEAVYSTLQRKELPQMSSLLSKSDEIEDQTTGVLGTATVALIALFIFFLKKNKKYHWMGIAGAIALLPNPFYVATSSGFSSGGGGFGGGGFSGGGGGGFSGGSFGGGSFGGGGATSRW